MAIVDDAFLQDMSDLATDLALKDTAEILRDVPVRDDSGGYQDGTWPTVATSPCAVVVTGSPQEQFVGSETTNRVAQTILLPRGTDIRFSDRIRVNGTDTYHVIDFPKSSFDVLRPVSVTREELGAQ